MLKRLIHILIAAVTLVTVGACSDDSEGDPCETFNPPSSCLTKNAGDTGNTTSNNSSNGQDMEPDGNSGIDMGTPDSSVCEPLEACPADSCGAVDDGCGGELDCGVCECEGGEPVEPRCGPCELGTTVCTSQTAAACEVPPIAEGAISCDDFIFVLSGTALNNGSKEAPHGSVRAALEQAREGDRIIVAPGDGYEEPIVMKEGVDISGAFRIEEGLWTYNEAFKAEVVVPASPDDDVIGVLAEGISEETHLRNFDIETADAAAGKNNYGVLVTQSPGLVVANLTVRTGRGGDGAAGEPGEPGAEGNAGSDGATFAAGRSGCEFNSIGNFRGAIGGRNNACPTAKGGAGGDGASLTVNNRWWSRMELSALWRFRKAFVRL